MTTKQRLAMKAIDTYGAVRISNRWIWREDIRNDESLAELVLNQSLRDRAARALDATHAIGEQGPRTLAARAAVAAWLDTGRGSVAGDVTWLERAIDADPERPAVMENCPQ